jgi:cysteine-rich repeat protein
MRISRSIWLLSAATAAALIGCGSDVGGDPADDASTLRDGARADSAVDGARPGDGNGGPLDGGGSQSDADGGARADTSVPPDTNLPPPDGSADVSGGSDASDVRSDAREAGGDLTDARLDISIDTGSRDGGDAADGGPTSLDGPIGPGCGNGQKEAAEECDDGNTRDFDGCSSFCTDRRPCDCCVSVNYGGPLTCADVDGDAEAGPKAGTSKAQLCNELYACVLRSRCGFSGPLMDCYCGTGNTTDDTSGCKADPRGPCVAQLEAGMEAEGATWGDRVKVIYGRMSDNSYGGGKTMERWIFEGTACPDNCGLHADWGGACPSDPGTPDAGEGGASIDSTVDTPPARDASDAAFDGVATDAPPDASGGGAVVLADGRVLTIDKDCSDCLIAAGQDPNACNTLTGTAAGGPAAGTLKSVLCRETLDCMHQTSCHANAVYDCYCGTGAPDLGVCNTSTTAANGVCKTQLDRSLEVPPGSAGSVALDRLTDATNYAGGTAGLVATYEDTLFLRQTSCRDVCIPYTPTE